MYQLDRCVESGNGIELSALVGRSKTRFETGPKSCPERALPVWQAKNE